MDGKNIYYYSVKDNHHRGANYLLVKVSQTITWNRLSKPQNVAVTLGSKPSHDGPVLCLITLLHHGGVRR